MTTTDNSGVCGPCGNKGPVYLVEGSYRCGACCATLYLNAQQEILRLKDIVKFAQAALRGSIVDTVRGSHR